MKKIKIYFDDKPLHTGHSVRGIGSYTRNLLQYLKKDTDLEIVTSLEAAQIIHYPYFDLFYPTLKIIPNKINIVTIYDVIPLLYPNAYPSGIKGKINFLRQKNKLKQVDAVVTISETSKKDIVRLLDVPANKIYPIHLAAESVFRKISDTKSLSTIRDKYALPKEFVLYVGDVNYNKNLLQLIEAVKKIGNKLVIIGKQAKENNFNKSHPENKSLVEIMEKYGNDPDIIRLGFVENEDLVKIYNLATVYCQPSLYEGFGLPILEAMQCGTPVLISKIQTHMEVTDNAALYFNPKKDELPLVLDRVLKNSKLLTNMARLGLNRSKMFCWDKTSRQTVEVYKNLI